MKYLFLLILIAGCDNTPSTWDRYVYHTVVPTCERPYSVGVWIGKFQGAYYCSEASKDEGHSCTETGWGYLRGLDGSNDPGAASHIQDVVHWSSAVVEIKKMKGCP
jgi:hypothetical protein